MVRDASLKFISEMVIIPTHNHFTVINKANMEKRMGEKKYRKVASFPFRWKNKNDICNYNDNPSRLDTSIHQKMDFNRLQHVEQKTFDSWMIFFASKVTLVS